MPHELGLLDGVATYWVNAGHGDLAKSDGVLDAIGDLLQRGATDRLPATRPQPRGAARGGWVRAARTEAAEAEGDAEVAAISGAARGRGAGARARLTPQEAVRLDDLILGDYLGRGGAAPAEAPPAAGPSARREGGPSRSARLPVDVVWGDVTRVEADVYVAGHYIGVIPQNAELALDRVVSGIPRGAEDSPARIWSSPSSPCGGCCAERSARSRFFPWGIPGRSRKARRHRRDGPPRHLQPPGAAPADA